MIETPTETHFNKSGRPRVYEYESARRFVLDFIKYLEKEDSLFSIRKWAKNVGSISHTLVVLILQNKRALTLKQAPAFAKGFGLSPSESLYFQGLIQLDSTKTSEDRNLSKIFLSQLSPVQSSFRVEIDEFQVLSEWIHMAVLASTFLKVPLFHEEQVIDLFRSRATSTEVRAAMARLMDQKLLVFTKDGYRSVNKAITTTEDKKNLGAQIYHRKTLEMASSAIENQSLDEREFQGFSIPIQKNAVPLAKALIRDFRSQFEKAIGSDAADAVYHFNLCFFRLTEHPSKFNSKVDEGVGTIKSKKKSTKGIKK